MQEALGSNARLMIELIPELEFVIGSQPPLPHLSPQDAQNRLHRMFDRFIGVFARPDRPLVLFLDDLQWLDSATLSRQSSRNRIECAALVAGRRVS